MIVYITRNLINNKCYIGRDLYNNPNYLGSGKLLKKAIQKYGRDNFRKDVLQYCNSLDELYKAEEYWIRYYNAACDDNFYNILDGSTGGDTLSNHPNLDNIKMKIRQAREKQVIQHSEDTRRKISESQRGENGFWYGKTQSTESNMKRSNKMKGVPKPKMICIHCGKEGSVNGIKRWHLDNCKVLTGKPHKPTNPRPWNYGKTKTEFPQLTNCGVKKGNTPWNKNLNNK